MAGDQALSDVVIPNITGRTIVEAYALFQSDYLNTAAGNNNVESDQYIQVDQAAAGYINAIKLETGCLPLGNIQRGHTRLFVGDLDIITRVAFNATTNFKWALADAAVNSYIFDGALTGVRLLLK